MPFTVSLHQERDIFGMVILIAHHHVEHHPAEHFLGFRIGQTQGSHHMECLFVGIGPMQALVIMSHTAKCLHVDFLTILAVETLCQEMGTSILLNE